MFYYLTKNSGVVAPIAIFVGIDGFFRAKNLREALQKFDSDSFFQIRIVRQEYMWAIEAEEENEYTGAPSYYLFETWDEAADFGNKTYSVFDTDCDIIELNMVENNFIV